MKLFISIYLTAFFMLPAWGSENKPTIEIVKHPSSAWRFSHVNTYVSDEGVRVKGRMSASHRYGLPRGHIDIAAYTPSGELITETTTSYTPRLLTYRAKRKGGVRFSSTISKELPPNSVIKVAFHSNKSRTKQNPIHEKTTAR